GRSAHSPQRRSTDWNERLHPSVRDGESVALRRSPGCNPSPSDGALLFWIGEPPRKGKESDVKKKPIPWSAPRWMTLYPAWQIAKQRDAAAKAAAFAPEEVARARARDRYLAERARLDRNLGLTEVTVSHSGPRSQGRASREGRSLAP